MAARLTVSCVGSRLRGGCFGAVDGIAVAAHNALMCALM